jgi:subtilisin family serine protease
MPKRFPLRLLVALVIGLCFVALRPAGAADDPYANHQWSLTQIHAPSAWPVSTGSGIKIGIVDSGVNKSHEDLAGKIIASATCINTSGSSTKCSAGPNDGDDINGHGTHVAGIAAANTGNGLGIAGVAPNAKLIVARAFSGSSAEPTAELDDVKAAIDWVVSQGAQIVNLSLGTDTGTATLLCGSLTRNALSPAIEDAWNRGALPIVASGNSGSTACYANLDAIVVGATGPDGSVEPYSSAVGSAKWGIVAPGGDDLGVNAKGDPRCADPSRNDCPMVLSTYTKGDCSPSDAPNCYAYLSGTSMSTPQVSGAAALLFAHGLTRQEVVDTLLATADPIDCGSNCAGRLNIARAFDVVPNDTNPGPSGGGGHTTTTRKSSSSSGGTAKPGATTSTPTTSPFTFNGEPLDPSTTFGRQRPKGAIVLQSQPRDDKSVPVLVGLAGIVSLAGAALAMSYNLRKTLTTLP